MMVSQTGKVLELTFLKKWMGNGKLHIYPGFTIKKLNRVMKSLSHSKVTVEA